MAKDYMLSTIDNPYNPFVNFDEWLQYDTFRGYNTLSYLARIAKVNSDMDDDEYNRETNRAIDEIVSINPTGLYIRVYEDTEVKPQILEYTE